MRSPLFWKLFGLQLLAAAVLIISALAVMRFYTATNFMAFIESQQQQRLQDIATDLARVYASNGDLQQAARQILRGPPQSRPPREDDFEGFNPPPPPRRRGPPGAFPPRGEPPMDQPDQPRPAALRVLSLDGQVLAGYLHDLPPQDELRTPVIVSGATIGYVARPRPQGPPLPDQQRFEQQQLRGLIAIGGCALLLAALIALALTALILRPIRRLSSGVTALAQRNFSARLPVTSHDELGQLAANFNQLATALEHYDSRQRQWLADIAHELRTPLAILRGELEALLDGVRLLDSKSARSLHQEALRLTRLVDDLHLLSLAESGGLTLHRELTPVSALVADSAGRFRERFHTRGYKLEVDAGTTEMSLQLDPQRMDQLLANLLENTLRHADPPGPVTVSVEHAGPHCRITVADSGPGVATAALSKLFDRLYRTDAARSRAAGGSGLGLAICRSIAEAHGGRILARRSERGGLAVDVLLPATRSP